MTLDSEGIISDGDAFHWLAENIDDKFQITTNNDGYTLYLRTETLHGEVEERARFGHGSVTHENLRGVRPRHYEGRKRGETLRFALAKHFEELEPGGYEERDVERHADKTGDMTAEEVVNEYSPYYAYNELFTNE